MALGHLLGPVMAKKFLWEHGECQYRGGTPRLQMSQAWVGYDIRSAQCVLGVLLSELP